MTVGGSRRNSSNRRGRGILTRVACALCFLLAAPGLQSAAQVPQAPGDSNVLPEIAIIIDDLGGRASSGRRVIELPGPVACAFLPYAAHTHDLALLAHGANKEVMLHLPMETVEGRPLDAGALRLDMSEQEFIHTLQTDLERVPHVSGVNNHMGSLLTRHPGHMLWLMREIQRQNRLFFVDSRTTKHTVAQLIAYENGVPSVSRDVFLDADPSLEGVRREFKRLLGLARRQGSALAIGHPLPTTLAVLEEELPRLANRGVKLVPVSRLVERQHERDPIWRASLFP